MYGCQDEVRWFQFESLYIRSLPRKLMVYNGGKIVQETMIHL